MTGKTENNPTMKNHKNYGASVFLFLILTAVFHMSYYYLLLPETVASHFDISGKPDGWMDKKTFIGLYAGLILFMGITFLGTSFSFSKLPISLINLPNKDYWLKTTPERREETFRFMSDSFLHFGSLTLAFLISTMHLAFRVNLGHAQTLGNSFYFLLIFYIVLSVLWCIGLYRKFAVLR